MYKFNLNVHALPSQRQIVNIRADRVGKHTVLTFCPVLKKTKLQAGVMVCCRVQVGRSASSSDDRIPPVARGNVSAVMSGMWSSSPTQHATRWASCISKYLVRLVRFHRGSAMSRRATAKSSFCALSSQLRTVCGSCRINWSSGKGST